MRRNLTLIISEVIAMIFTTLFFANICSAGTVTVPTTWITGDSVTATKLNNINSAFANVINGGLDNDNADTANGYFFFKRVAALPSAGTQGAVYFLTSDNTLNLDTGAAFVTAATISGSHAQGDVVYYNGSSFTGLAAGTSGYVLKTQGAGANPTWQAASNTTGANIVPITDASGYLPANSVNTLALKTSTQEQSFSSTTSLYLSGGSYCFLPQIKVAGGGAGWNVDFGNSDSGWSTNVGIYNTRIVATKISGADTMYIQQRYVTGSGTDEWIFLLINKQSGEIVQSFEATDAPSVVFDNKADHPFINYDETTQQIVLIDKDTSANLKNESVSSGKSILELINNYYKVDLYGGKAYQPLHSGKYLTENGQRVKEMVQRLPEYIKVKGLIHLTDSEIASKESARKAQAAQFEQEQLNKEHDKQSAINKLKALGLTESELEALKK